MDVAGRLNLTIHCADAAHRPHRLVITPTRPGDQLPTRRLKFGLCSFAARGRANVYTLRSYFMTFRPRLPLQTRQVCGTIGVSVCCSFT